MRVIVSYDVAVNGEGGKRRLRRVAKLCKDYGLRVQNSVFECEIDWAGFLELKARLLREINMGEDSLRIYNLGAKWAGKVEHFGVRAIADLGRDTLLL